MSKKIVIKVQLPEEKKKGIKVGKHSKRGKRGRPGLMGPKGDVGFTGPAGIMGKTGEQGPQGKDGEPGRVDANTLLDILETDIRVQQAIRNILTPSN